MTCLTTRLMLALSLALGGAPAAAEAQHRGPARELTTSRSTLTDRRGEFAAARLHGELEAAARLARHRAGHSVYVFGDSYTDTGNLYSLIMGRLSSLFPVFEVYFEPPFAVPRVSNGPMWPDYLGAILGTRIEPSELGGTNYAIGAATISPENYYTFDPYLTGFAQVDRFLAAHGEADPRAVYVVWLGTNDIDPPVAFTEWNFEQLVALISRLHAAGARKFLVPNMVDLGKLPGLVAQFEPAYLQQLSEMSVHFNQLIAGLPDRFPDARIGVPDLYRLRALVERYPRAFGFTDATEPCYRSRLVPGADESLCSDPDRHWYFDWNHPTTRAHSLIAGLFALELWKAGELFPHR